MTSPAPEFAAVLARLDRLERLNDDLRRQLRRQRWWRAAFLGLAAAAVGVSCQSRPDPKASATETAIGPKAIEAEKFVLKDAQGRVHGMLTIGPDGPALLFLDPEKDRQPRLGLICSKAAMTMKLYDDAGKERLALSAGRQGARVVLFTNHGTTCCGLLETPLGPQISLLSPDVQRSLNLAVTDDSEKLTIFRDKVVRVGIGVTPEGPSVILFDSQGKIIFAKP
jgi:hypothetical protein